MTFTEANPVEQMILDAVGRRGDQTDSVLETESVWPSVLREVSPGFSASLGGAFRPTHWDCLPAAELPRQSGDVMVEAWAREALVRLNPKIAAQPDRAD